MKNWRYKNYLKQKTKNDQLVIDSFSPRNNSMIKNLAEFKSDMQNLMEIFGPF